MDAETKARQLELRARVFEVLAAQHRREAEELKLLSAKPGHPQRDMKQQDPEDPEDRGRS
jgi:hypothetical protein